MEVRSLKRIRRRQRTGDDEACPPVWTDVRRGFAESNACPERAARVEGACPERATRVEGSVWPAGAAVGQELTVGQGAELQIPIVVAAQMAIGDPRDCEASRGIEPLAQALARRR